MDGLLVCSRDEHIGLGIGESLTELSTSLRR